MDHTITLTGTDFWRVQDGKGYGFQFGIVTANDYVSIVADGTSLVLPFSSVKENSFALVTRVSATLWVAAGAGADINAFILNSSLLSGGDFYG